MLGVWGPWDIQGTMLGQLAAQGVLSVPARAPGGRGVLVELTAGRGWRERGVWLKRVGFQHVGRSAEGRIRVQWIRRDCW